MGRSFDSVVPNLLCYEETDGLLDHELACCETDDFGVLNSETPKIIDPQKLELDSDDVGSHILPDLPLLTEEVVKKMVEKEKKHLPRDDYLKRLRNGDLLSLRREALTWILKVHSHYGFGHLCMCLSINYLDRFLSVYDCPSDRNWTIQLLAVACLSLAAKVEEIAVPLSVDLQVGETKFFFEAKTILRMEIFLLSALNWRMQSITPCSFIDYFLSRVNSDNQPSQSLISRSVQLILSTLRVIDFLEFKPSEIAAAVSISVSGQIQALDSDKIMPCLNHVEKGRVLKCIQLIKDLMSVSQFNSNGSDLLAPSFPHSPIDVLDASTCLSCKSSDTAGSSCTNSAHNSPDTKRKKLD